MRLFRLVLLSLLLILSTPITNAFAVPTLGVATTNGYVYTGTEPPDDAYISYFVDSKFVQGQYEGFIIGPSGSTLTVFTNITGQDIYLGLENQIYTTNSPITFSGSALTQFDITPKFDGYNSTPYWGVNLGDVTTDGWTTLPNPPFPGTYYSKDVTFNYSGTLPLGYYVFAFSLEPRDFSPKTSSATTVPVPPALMLLGSGLLGLIGIRRKVSGNDVK